MSDKDRVTSDAAEVGLLVLIAVGVLAFAACVIGYLIT
jgi:hypothetical protein